MVPSFGCRALSVVSVQHDRTPFQKGTAPLGYYPIGYNGDLFSGEPVPSDDANGIKLVYKNGAKSESFEGRIESPCQAPTQADPLVTKELHWSAIPRGPF